MDLLTKNNIQMKKSAEEFIREKSFPNGITEDKWEEHKHNHSGTNWVGFAIKAMEEHTKQELIAFKKWYDKLKPTDKISVWSEDGSQKGLFNLSDEQIIENWNRYQEPKNTKFENPVLPAGRLTNYQKRILFELAMGGKIFAFQFPDEYGFDDVDGNSYSFRKDTFDTLMNMGLIEVAERPSLTCQTYGLTKKAESLLAACR